jgi:hypothetical protein
MVLLACAAASLPAQDKAICSLLTASDVSALGVTGAGIETSMPYDTGAQKGSMKLCNWRMPTGGIHLAVVKVPPGASRESLDKLKRDSWAMLEAQGWTKDKQDFGGISCLLMTPPAAQKSAPLTTECSTLTKGTLVQVSTLGKTKVPMEKAKALVESVIGRL